MNYKSFIMGIFTKPAKPLPEPPPISAAEKLNIAPPRLSRAHAAGLDAAAAISRQREDASLKRYEAQRDARKKAAAEYEAFLWAKIAERMSHAVG